jgi:hypothetical protein
MYILFLISILITFPFIQPATNERSFLTIESSAIGLTSSCKEELEAIMISYFRSPEDDHLFYSLLKSRYFDYSPVLLSICEVIDNERFSKVLSDLVENHLPEELIADCISVRAKNSPWTGKMKYPVNPLISTHFNTKDWSFDQLKYFASSAIKDKSIKIRWNLLLQANYEKLQLFFEPQNSLWTMIKASDITDTSKALFIVKHLVNDVENFNIQEKSEEILCKMILFAVIKRRFHESIFYRFRSFLLGTNKRNLLLNLEYSDLEFIEQLFLKIKAVATPAIILNFLELFKDQIEEGLFIQALTVFFNTHQVPTMNEVCVLLRQKRFFNIINLYLSNRIDLLFEVFRECPQNIPQSLIRDYISLQLRLQEILKKHRKLVERNDKLVFNLPNLNLSAKEQFDFMLRELNYLFMEVDFKEFDVYNYPVLDHIRKKSFVMAIDRVFLAFINCKDYYILLEDGSIIPNLINLDPKLLESIGYFLGAAIILQHPINFRLNEGYFSLLRSNIFSEYHQILLQVYPQEFRAVLPIAILAKKLEIGVNYLYSGLLKAFEAQYFSTTELYELLFNI